MIPTHSSLRSRAVRTSREQPIFSRSAPLAPIADLPDHLQRVAVADEGENIGDGADTRAARFLTHGAKIRVVG
jgi:hypothetical protein